jgi:hypothetical protein
MEHIINITKQFFPIHLISKKNGKILVLVL